ncbi:dihydrodipicolinate synthase family protein [Agrobacterium tumefaciens]|uniref:dihydrodipicolinate synthase family protein n=1 Tax=Agrobacterium TaxID=357 RepID=UPI0009BA8F03|nr:MULTISPECIES: dihydrodipicolinate synthase family protein [Agrobacterium]MBS0258049.1 dihydrodipicolinate synthase family protein [Pseudomonadota bacterium]MDA5242901.1 dihydrodipicolinate synthase family protein [Agrobacterium sp. MAFF310724]MDA5247803.1 dihydrodipicolinate synthase family protein [Agrobacterium sp. MAFF210268]TRB14990.1 dihydrodipicolinate synthase family protein [Agrobacterium tumefaciens]WCA61036.1 dihydrodipicolinate synthase family protein [Agrobacterium tumefaciens]
MTKRIEGIIPVMITPFRGDKIDFEGVANLVEWYIANGSDALFAVCQSSEMMFLSLEERVELAAFVKKAAAGRIPVIASGHISETLEDQQKELNAIAQTGVDGMVLVTNRLDARQEGNSKFLDDLGWLLERLPSDLPLGLYECPAPYRRLMTDAEISFCANSGRFVILKDVSCDLETVKRRVALTANTPLAIVNANAAIAFDAMKAGSRGFTGVFTNFHPDLYKWLLTEAGRQPELADELSVYLALAAMAEPMGYPKLAKLYHQRLGTISDIESRAVTFDIQERFWAIEALLDKIMQGTEEFRRRISR